MQFRDRLIETLRAARPLFEVPAVVVIGSEVPNLMQVGAAATLVVSQDLDLGIPVGQLAAVKARLPLLRQAGYSPSADEPSVWVPNDAQRLEINFVGIDPRTRHASETYVLEDAELPLMVFGPLGWVRHGTDARVDDLSVPLPEPTGLALEKLVTDRSGIKGDRDLLVALGLLLQMPEHDVEQLVARVASLEPELRDAVVSNLTLLSLIEPHAGMPDPLAGRPLVASLVARIGAS